MRTRQDFRYEGEKVFSEGEYEDDEDVTLTFPQGQAGYYVYDVPGLRVQIKSVPAALIQARPAQYARFLNDDINEAFSPTITRGLTIHRGIVAYPAEGNTPAEVMRCVSVTRMEPQPVQVIVAASPERWREAEAILTSIYIPPDHVVASDVIHPFVFKGRSHLVPNDRKGPKPFTIPNGYRYEYLSGEITCQLDVVRARRFDLDAVRAEFASLNLQRGVRFGTGATWLHLRGVAKDGRPMHLFGARFGGSNLIARASVVPGVDLPAEIDALTSSAHDPAPVEEPVNADMFERNVIVGQTEITWGGKAPEFRVDSLPITLSGPNATFSVNDGYEIKGTVTRAVEPFGEEQFGILERELPLDNATFLLHAVRSDGFESFIFDGVGQYGRGTMNYFMQRPQTPALTVRISNDAGFPPPFWETMEVADPVKGWVSFGWPGDDLPKGFAYFWTNGLPIRDGLWVAAPYPSGWRVKSQDLDWAPKGGGMGVNRFSIESDKLFVYGLPSASKLDDKRVLRRLQGWAHLTGSTLSGMGRWEKVAARGKTYDVYKTTATRDGVEREVWHYRGPKVAGTEERHTFLLECKSSDAASRDAWLKLNEVPPPPMRRSAPY